MKSVSKIDIFCVLEFVAHLSPLNISLPLTRIDEKMIRQILQSYRMHNADVMIREDVSQ